MIQALLKAMLMIPGLSDFPEAVAERPEVAVVSVAPAKAQRQRRIIHLCNWHMVPRELFAKAMTADGKTEEEIDEFYSEHLTEVESVPDEQRSLLPFLIEELKLRAVYIEGLIPDEVEHFKKRAAMACRAKVRDDDPTEQFFAAIVRGDKLMIGIAGQLNAVGKLDVLPSEDRVVFEAANPVGTDGEIHTDGTENETRESAIVRNMLKAGPVSFIVLGNAHDLADNIPDDCEYVRIETDRVTELLKVHHE